MVLEVHRVLPRSGCAPNQQDDVMGVGEDPVVEDGMDIDAPAWPPAGVETADEGVIREGDPGDFYMKVIAKKFRGVWHYGVITGVVTEWVLEIYGGATQWRAVFEDGDTVDLLRSEVVEAVAAAQEHSSVDADGEACLATVPEGDNQPSESEEEGWEEALVLLDGPGIRKVAVLMAPAHMSSANAADLGVDAGELLVAGIHARSQDGARGGPAL
eukprot:jgi/Tetstr1/449093/TSEL_036305.t1